MSCVQTPYYLITDADTFFLRSFEALDLLHQEEGCDKTSGVCDLQKQVHRHLQVLCGRCKPQWYPHCLLQQQGRAAHALASHSGLLLQHDVGKPSYGPNESQRITEVSCVRRCISGPGTRCRTRSLHRNPSRSHGFPIAPTS